jgi:hypothetical protein
MRYPDYIEAPFPFPPVHRVRMNPPRSPLTDVSDAVKAALASVRPGSGIRPGDRVAVGVGSRGITRLPEMVRALCEGLREGGARPFILPAMGSHGGATADGQERVLARLGVTEASCGAPVRSSMAAVRIGTAFEDVPVYFSEAALAADHSVCINRIKPHTKFKAPLESGIFKMLCIGMGKHEGALAYHRHALRHGFYPLLRAIGEAVMARSNFRFGIAVVEDAHDDPVRIEGLPISGMLRREQDLLRMAIENMARLPFRSADVLVIGRIGKEISGAGMDPNITGRAVDLMEDDFSGCFSATRIAVLSLSAGTAGNAVGVGNADIITERVFADIDYEATVMNALTGISLHKANIPVRLPSDEKAIQACFTTIGPVPSEAVRAVFIRDTRHLTEFYVTPALIESLKGIAGVTVDPPAPLRFDGEGNLIDPPVRDGD